MEYTEGTIERWLLFLSLCTKFGKYPRGGGRREFYLRSTGIEQRK